LLLLGREREPPGEARDRLLDPSSPLRSEALGGDEREQSIRALTPPRYRHLQTFGDEPHGRPDRDLGRPRVDEIPAEGRRAFERVELEPKVVVLDDRYSPNLARSVANRLTITASLLRVPS
jgi:hypothetical protein